MIIRGSVTAAAVVLLTVLTGCSNAVTGTADLPPLLAGGFGAPVVTGSAVTTARPANGGLIPPTNGAAPVVGSGAGAPPAWVVPGMRITWYEAAASVAQSRFSWVEDPAGTWTDPRTGKHYRRTDESGEGQPGAGGDGVSQVDVLAVDGNTVVLSNALYGIDRTNNVLITAGVSGAAVPGESVEGAWISPAKLSQLQTQDLGGLLLLVGDYPYGGSTVKAISFVNPAPKAYSSYTYDASSGLLLSATTSTASPTSPIAAAGEAPPAGNTQLTVTRLAGVRMRATPGLGTANPSWVAQTPTLNYQGTYNFTNPVDPSSANVTYPMSVSVSLHPGGAAWASYSADQSIQMPGGQPTKTVGTTAGSGLYWIDPTALRGLQPGTVLDTDPLTTEKDVVSSVTDGMVTITSTLPGIVGTAAYASDTGVLALATSRQSSSGGTYQLQLQR